MYSASAELQYDIDIGFVFEDAVELDDVGMVEIPMDLDFQ